MNATQRALLKAIAAAPHDDTPRLVYADWLDEHAAELPKKERESTAARAEIIRAQCELARLAEEDNESRWVYEYLESEGLYDLKNDNFRVDWSELDPGLARRVALRARMLELTALYGENWKKHETPSVKGASFDLRRGFWTFLTLDQNVTNVGQTAKEILKHSTFIPLEAFSCQRQLTEEEAEKLVTSGLIDNVRAVWDLDWERSALFAAIGRTKIATGIREVCPASSGRNYMAAFVKSKKWNSIRTIQVVAHGDHGIPGLDKLARSSHLANIQSLCFNDDARAEWWAVEAVSQGVWKKLRRLDWDAWISDDTASTIATGTALRDLRYLRLSNRVGGDSAATILTYKTPEKLVVIDLHGNEIRGLSATAFKKAKRPNLRVLNLGNANQPYQGKKGLSKADLLTVTTSPVTHHIQILNLAGNELTDSAMKDFFHKMQMPQLTMLNLEFNEKLGPATAEALAACDRLGNLQSLKLMWTKFGNAGAKSLAKSKHLTKLRAIEGAHQAGITDSGLTALRKRFGEDVVRS